VGEQAEDGGGGGWQVRNCNMDGGAFVTPAAGSHASVEWARRRLQQGSGLVRLMLTCAVHTCVRADSAGPSNLQQHCIPAGRAGRALDAD
jgi:hypothetical protein